MSRARACARGGFPRRLSALLLVGCLSVACSADDDAAATGATGGGGAPAVETVATRTTGPPNLVLITLDTTRADALGAYGQTRPTTPNIDRMANEGVLFEHAMTSSPETLPSHATLFTGAFPYVHGVRANAGYLLSEENETLAERLSSHGYVTGAQVAALVLRRDTQITQGFDDYRDPDSPGVKLKTIRYTQGENREVTKPMRTGGDITRQGIRFIEKHRGDRFFLWLHYFDAHDPYSAPRIFNQRISDSTYHAEVASADFQIGLFIAELERLGLRENTLVALTADHGEGLSEHDEPTHSYFVYDTTMRVPLILWGPSDLPRGRRIASLVRTTDVAPTVLDLMGLPGAFGPNGQSLRPLLDIAAEPLELTAYGEASRFAATFGLPMLRFVREGQWKYIHKVEPELYDVIADPGELDNVIDRHPEVAARLEARLAEMLAESEATGGGSVAALDSDTAAQLAALGYVAHSPAAALEASRAEPMALSGVDPRTLSDDTLSISIALGKIQRKEFADARDLLLGVHQRSPRSAYVLRLLAASQRGAEAHDAADASLGSLLELEPCDDHARDELRNSLAQRGRVDEMLGVLAQGVERCPESIGNLNNYAWSLATLPEAHLRDGAKAVALIRPVIDAMAKPEPAYLDTLAAALAETGDFSEAARIEMRVLEALRAGHAPQAVLDQVSAQLESFRAGKPVRAPAGG